MSATYLYSHGTRRHIADPAGRQHMDGRYRAPHGDRHLNCVEDLLTPDEQAALAADLAHMALIRRLTGGLP